MTFEEGLERLKERHEALTQSVELIAADIRQLTAENRQMAAENKERDNRLGQIMEGVARLLHVAEIHEHRITRLEGTE
jgi:prefoldin subunit 5